MSSECERKKPHGKKLNEKFFCIKKKKYNNNKNWVSLFGLYALISSSFSFCIFHQCAKFHLFHSQPPLLPNVGLGEIYSSAQPLKSQCAYPFTLRSPHKAPCRPARARAGTAVHILFWKLAPLTICSGVMEMRRHVRFLILSLARSEKKKLWKKKHEVRGLWSKNIHIVTVQARKIKFCLSLIRNSVRAIIASATYELTNIDFSPIPAFLTSDAYLASRTVTYNLTAFAINNYPLL